MTESKADFGLNDRAWHLFQQMREDAAGLRVAISRGSSGEYLMDAGAATPGGIEAGLRIAKICMGGMGHARIVNNATIPRWPWTITVASSLPVIACLGSQYAGWRLLHGEGRDGFFALGSGPARAAARREDLFNELGYGEAAGHAVLVLESPRPPPAPLVKRIAEDCQVPAEELAIIYAPTQSLVGSVQVVARVLEVALHKAHALHFPLERILDGMGAAPLAPPHPDFVTAMGRTNDAIIFGGRVQLFVSGPAADAKALAEALPASASRDYGRPFAEIFASVKGDFYAIDPMLFSTAEAQVTAVETGETFRGGRLDPDLLDASFGHPAG